MGFLNRTGFKETALYSNVEDVDTFLDSNKPSYIGGFASLLKDRTYSMCANLKDCLMSGKKVSTIGENG